MLWRPALGALIALLLGTGGTAAGLPPIDQRQIDQYKRQNPYSSGILQEWETALKASLASASPDVAAEGLAGRFGLSVRDMRELVRLWLVAKTYNYSDRTEAIGAELRGSFLSLLAATGRSRLVLQAAVSDIRHRGACEPSDFDALMAGASDRASEAWSLATYGDCLSWYGRFVEIAPARSTPALFRLLRQSVFRTDDALALYAYLASKPGLAHIRSSDRPAVALRLRRARLKMFLGAGLVAEALDLVGELPAPVLENVLAPTLPELTMQADGLDLRLEKSEDGGALKLALAAALALEDRKQEAERMLASLEGLEAARKSFDCAYSQPAQARRGDCRTNARHYSDFAAMMLDHFLHRRSEDPYPMAEVYMAGGGGWTGSAPLAELECRLFGDPKFGNVCTAARESVVRSNRGDHHREAGKAAAILALAKVPGQNRRRAAYAARLDRINVSLGGATVRPDGYPTRPTIEAPSPAPFAQHPIPSSLVGAPPRKPEGLSEMANLPTGFQPVRIDREGDRVAVISVSQNYDPTGEVSRGGYWVHLSDDGGRSWRSPLYTGLAEHFPYVVQHASALPLLDGDVLNLAVDIEEVDTGSITYPPVALRVRRSEKNLLVRASLAELSRDSDGDGLSDIAEKRLLIDAPVDGAATPLVVGSGDLRLCGASKPEQEILAAILEKIFSAGTGALVEPVRGQQDSTGPGGWGSASVSTDRPIFLVGEPGAFHCLRSNRLMIVYSEADIERLKRRSPDFHAVAMPHIVLNRAGDRGYANWSAIWTGGTYRLRRDGETWKLEEGTRWMT